MARAAAAAAERSPQEELLDRIFDAVLDNEDAETVALVEQALADKIDVHEILNEALIAAMDEVGDEFAEGRIFVPEILMAARAMKAGMAYIEPILSESGIEPVGTVIIGTVKGDLHDIGKNLCIMMLRGAGFVVHDLGVDTKPDEFIDAIMEHDAHILGMSALLTTTMPNMGRTIEAIEEVGMRDAVKVMVGGAPLSQEFADDMGADGYGGNAIECVDIAKEFAGVKSASASGSD